MIILKPAILELMAVVRYDHFPIYNYRIQPGLMKQKLKEYIGKGAYHCGCKLKPDKSLSGKSPRPELFNLGKRNVITLNRERDMATAEYRKNGFKCTRYLHKAAAAEKTLTKTFIPNPLIPFQSLLLFFCKTHV